MERGRGPKVLKSKSPSVPRSKCQKETWSQGPKDHRYLKVTFEYELDSREGPSCSSYLCSCLLLIKTPDRLLVP